MLVAGHVHDMQEWPPTPQLSGCRIESLNEVQEIDFTWGDGTLHLKSILHSSGSMNLGAKLEINENEYKNDIQ
jgi:hypothetical protein